MFKRAGLAATAGLVLVLTAGVGTALADSGPTTKEVDWVLAPGSTTASPFAGGEQHLYTGQCGNGIIQKDVYRYGTEQQKQLVDSLIAAGVLDHYADSPVFLSVTWEQQTPCVVTTPAPTPVPTPVQQPTPPAPAPAPAPVPSAPRAAAPAAPAAPVVTHASFTG